MFHDSNRDSVLTLAAVCLAALVLPLSFTGGAVATPEIGLDLGGKPVVLTWITNAFMLTFGNLLMAAGALADQYGRKRLFSLGMVLFAIISLALAAAPSLVSIAIFRAVQGVVAALALASGTAALAQEFEGHARTRAFSLLGTTFGLGLAFGPLLTGSLIELFGWRCVFVFTALIAVIALVFGIPHMRETRDPNAAGIDGWGTLTFSSLLITFTVALIQAPTMGWSNPVLVVLLSCTVLLFAAFIMIERRVMRPMLDLSLFRYPRFVGVQILPIGTCYGFIVLIVLLPLRFIGIEGIGAIDSGLLMLTLSTPMLFVPSLVATLARRVSPGVLAGTGFIIAAAGLYWLSFLDAGDYGSAAMLRMLLIGMGAGMPWGLMDGLSVSVVPKERAGMAAGIFNTSRVAGEGIALAVVITVLSILIQRQLQQAVGAGQEMSSQTIANAAQQLAMGDMANAIGALPMFSRGTLVQAYVDSFKTLLHLLTAITVFSAIAVFTALGKNDSNRISARN